MNSVKIIGVLILGLVISFCIINLKSKEIKSLKQEKENCLLELDKANKRASEVNLVNNLNNDTTIKYNSQKKKDYSNEEDSDLNALHTLDVMLEQASIIK